MAVTYQYNPAAQKLTINGVLMTDAGPDTFLEFTPVDPASETTYGADGTAATSINVVMGYVLKITTIQNSIFASYLLGLLKVQQGLGASGLPVPSLQIAFIDTVSGSAYSGIGKFKTRPTRTSAKTVSTMDFEIEMPNVALTYTELPAVP